MDMGPRPIQPTCHSDVTGIPSYTGFVYEVRVLPVDWDSGVRHDLERVVRLFHYPLEAERYARSLGQHGSAICYLLDLAGMQELRISVRATRYLNGKDDEEYLKVWNPMPATLVATVRNEGHAI